MFLHSGASLHGHEYTNPQSPYSQQRKKPFLRSALPAPILRSSTSASLTDRPFSPSSAPKRPAVRRRPVSDVYVRPISNLLADDPSRTSAPTSPVVRFKEPDVVDTPSSSSSSYLSPMADDEDPSLYESDDTSQATCSTPRRRRRRATPRSSTTYLLAHPAPRPLSKKKLFKTIRPRLLLQLQELAPNQRPRPTIDVFPAALLAGPLVAARYIHRCPRLFGVHGELGPRDLVLFRSEDYTASDDDGDEQDGDASRQQPVAVLSPGRGPGDNGAVVLEDGTVWTWSSLKGYYEFVHVDKHGITVTVRWVKRSSVSSSSSNKRLSSGTAPWPGSPSCALPGSPPAPPGDSTDPDYRYTFSIINPLARRHPILATLTPHSLEVYNDYTTPSSSSGRYPPTRPVSGACEHAKDPPSSPLSFEEPPSRRETHPVDEEIKNLIRVTGLWLAMRLGPAVDVLNPEASPETPLPPPPPPPQQQQQQQQQDPALASAPTPSLRSSTTLPRRQTTTAIGSTSPSMHSRGSLRRAMSTGAAFMMQRKRRQEHAPSAPSSDTALVAGKITAMETPREDDEGIVDPSTPPPAGAAAVSAGGTAAKQARRVSWFKRLTH